MGDFTDVYLDFKRHPLPLMPHEADIMLIDALRARIESYEAFASDIVNDHDNPPSDADVLLYQRVLDELEPYRKMLADLERYGMDPTLNGLLK